MTSAAEMPSSVWMSTGMPRPLSVTVHRAVGVERHGDAVGMAGQRLVDGVVDHLVDHVVQAGAVIGVADIHARALAHRVEALENLDGIGAIIAATRCGRIGTDASGMSLLVSHHDFRLLPPRESRFVPACKIGARGPKSKF